MSLVTSMAKTAKKNVKTTVPGRQAASGRLLVKDKAGGRISAAVMKRTATKFKTALESLAKK